MVKVLSSGLFVRLVVHVHISKTIHQIGMIFSHKVGSSCGSVLRDGQDPDLDHESTIVFMIIQHYLWSLFNW